MPEGRLAGGADWFTGLGRLAGLLSCRAACKGACGFCKADLACQVARNLVMLQSKTLRWCCRSLLACIDWAMGPGALGQRVIMQG